MISKTTDTVLAFIACNFDRKIRLSEISALYGTRPARITKWLKDETGKTFLEILKLLRLIKAKNLLASTSLPISEVAKSCGFNTQVRFSRVFYNSEKMTPSQFRQANAAQFAYCPVEKRGAA